MKDFYNLDTIVSMADFPWEEIHTGIPKCKKNASIFYGHDAHEESTKNLTPEQRVWFRTIKYGHPLKGLDILLTNPHEWPGHWYRIDDPTFWKPTPDMIHFSKLQSWIRNSGIFSGTGRQIFFIQLQNQCTPPHVDEDRTKIPEGYSHQREFLWITSNTNGKKLLVNGKQTGHITWFNNYVEHQTLPENDVRWSLRIDGKFTDRFRESIKLL
jgi:hypothetical protein